MKYYSTFEITAENCLNNRAINYGDGVFETMLLQNKNIVLWDLHWQRLNSSLELLGLEPLNESLVYKNALKMAQDNGPYVLKLVVFRDDGKRGYSSHSKKCHFFMTLNPYKKTKISNQLTQSSVHLSKNKKLAGLKHLNRLEQVLAAQELINSNYDDAIMCDDLGCVVETINKNIILFKQNKIYSPELSESGVYGVALRWLQSQGHEINWKKIEFNHLAEYHGMMVCNSIQGFSSVIKIDNKINFEKDLKIADIIKTQWSEQC